MTHAEEDREEVFFNVLLREARLRAGFAMYYTAASVGMGYNTLHTWETGAITPRLTQRNIATFGRLEEFLGCTGLLAAATFSNHHLAYRPAPGEYRPYRGGKCKRGHPRPAEKTHQCADCVREWQRAQRDAGRIIGPSPEGEWVDGRTWRSQKTHCPQGHLYDEANTYVPPGGGERLCRECRRAAGRRYQQKKREH